MKTLTSTAGRTNRSLFATLPYANPHTSDGCSCTAPGDQGEFLVAQGSEDQRIGGTFDPSIRSPTVAAVYYLWRQNIASLTMIYTTLIELVANCSLRIDH